MQLFFWPGLWSPGKYGGEVARLHNLETEGQELEGPADARWGEGGTGATHTCLQGSRRSQIWPLLRDFVELGLRARALLPGSHAADTECQALAAQLAEEAPLSRRPATHSQYGGPWRSFLAWCRRRAPPVPPYAASPQLVALYLQSVLNSATADGSGPSRVDVAGKAIAFHYSLAGLPNPAAAESCANVRATAARRLQVQRLHREAMSAADLAAVLCAHAGPGAPLLRLMMATTVALMFYGFLRFDDMAEVSVHADLLLITPRHMAIFIPRSKTDVAMDGQWVHIARLPHLGGFCPVALTERLLRQGAYRRLPAAADEDVGPLLRTVQYTAAGGRLQRLVGTRASPVFSMSYGAFRSNFLARLREAGVSGNIKPHSMRIGGNSAAADAGVPASLRQVHGRWKPATIVGHYTRPTLEDTLGVTRAMGLAGGSLGPSGAGASGIRAVASVSPPVRAAAGPRPAAVVLAAPPAGGLAAGAVAPLAAPRALVLRGVGRSSRRGVTRGVRVARGVRLAVSGRRRSS